MPDFISFDDSKLEETGYIRTSIYADNDGVVKCLAGIDLKPSDLIKAIEALKLGSIQ